MVSIKFHKKHLKRTQIFFAKRPKIKHVIGFYDYFQCESINNVLGFIRTNCYTKLIDLTQSPNELLGLFNSTTRNEIKRSFRDGSKFSIETNVDPFVDFYNKFARTNNLELISSSYLASFKNNLFISKGVHDDECLVMHANIMDQDLKRVRILLSVSHFRNVSDSKKRALIGRVNRFLHFKDMIFAKNLNMERYDIGGYALNSENNILQGINKFKDGFGGELKRESNYTPCPIWILRKLKQFMNFQILSSH